MAAIDTDVATKLETQQKIALSFMIGTALVVVLAVAVAAVGTLVARPASTALPGDRTFQTR